MTLFETIGAILAGLVAIALAAWGLNLAFASLRLSETEQGLITLRMQTQHLFTGTDYTGLDNALAISAGIAPSVFVKGERLRNSWGGDVTLAAIPADAAFTIEIAGVPREECTKLARFQADAWREVNVNGADVTGGTVPEVANACTGSSTIIFTSR